MFCFCRYAVIACTSEGCVTSPQTNITTLEAPPVTVDPPSLNIAAHSIKASWSVPLTENGEVTEYVLRLNEEEVYRGRDLSVTLSELLPHTQYELVLLACNSGGCTPSATASGLKPGHLYMFEISAINKEGQSEPLFTGDPILAENPYSEYRQH